MEFLNIIFKGIPKEFVITLFTLPSRESKFVTFDDLANIRPWILKKVADNENVYFGVNPLHNRPSSGRGRAEDIGAMVSFSIDIDFKGEGHKTNKNYPPDWEVAKKVLINANCPLPSLVVFTGNGTHLYWLFESPSIVSNSSTSENESELFHKAIRNVLAQGGYEIDVTGDLARVLRVPGTKNFKNLNDPRPVVLWDDESTKKRYHKDELLTWAAAHAPTSFETIKKVEDASYKANVDEADASIMLNFCSFLQYCASNANTLPEPEWFAMINNLALAKKGGNDLVHKLSETHQNYTMEETQERIDRAQREQRPHTCETIHNLVDVCPYGGCAVKAPIALVTSHWSDSLEAVYTMLNKSGNPQITRRHHTDLAVLGANVPELYDRCMTRIGSLISKRELSELKKNVENIKQKKEDYKEEYDLTEIAGFSCKLPRGYKITEENVLLSTKDDRITEVMECPIYISARFIGDDEELKELSFNGKKIIVPASKIASNSPLVQLSNEGIPISEVNARAVVRYLHDFQKENRNYIPKKKMTRSLGWKQDGSFLPGNSDLNLILPGQKTPTPPSYWKLGTIEEWSPFANQACNYPYARLVLAAAFAAPLLKRLSHRNFVIYIFGTSAGGKSAAKKLGASVWGPVDEFFHDLDGTDAGIEGLLSKMRNLPVFLDEKQATDRDQKAMDRLVYKIANGKGKLRGSWHGESSSLGSSSGECWQTITCMSGEHALTNNGSAEGVQNRILEIYCEAVITDRKFASSLHSINQYAYGVAGEAFLNHILSISTEDLLTRYNSLLDDLTANNSDKREDSLSHLAVLAVSDSIRQNLFGDIEPAAAKESTINWIQQIAEKLPSAETTSESTRAYQYLKNWYQQKANYFTHLGHVLEKNDRYGWTKGNDLLINPNVIYEVLQEGRFNFDRFKFDWKREGRLKTHKNNKKTDYTVHVKEAEGRVVYLPDFLEIPYEDHEVGKAILIDNVVRYKKEEVGNTDE